MNKISGQKPVEGNPMKETSADPWRCEACGSLEVFYRTWVNSNTGRIALAVPDRDDLWCDRCGEHTYQTRESELMSDTVEPWWKDCTTEKDRAIITGLNPENFSSKDDFKAFRETCDMWWRSKTNDEKIRIWRQIATSMKN